LLKDTASVFAVIVQPKREPSKQSSSLACCNGPTDLSLSIKRHITTTSAAVHLDHDINTLDWLSLLDQSANATLNFISNGSSSSS